MEEKKMELMEMAPGEVGTLETAFMSTGMTYCSFNAETPEGKIALYTAMNNPTFSVEEKLNCTILLQDVYAEAVQFVNEKSGEVTDGVRIVLIDNEGNSYGCCSKGIFSAIKKLIQVYGAPTWVGGIPVQPYQTSTRNGNNKIYSLRIVK